MPAGVEVRGYLPDLRRHLAACDLAVVQGGLSTTMELTAAGRPFVYVPLGHHFEQQIHVPHRLARYRAGRRVDYAEAADPERLAESSPPRSAGLSTTGRSRPTAPPAPRRLLAELL